MKPKEILRWTAVLTPGGFGLYNITFCLRVFFNSLAERNWVWAIFMLFFTALVVGMPLAISYFALRREYRFLTGVIAAILAYCVFGALMSLPERLGIQQFFFQQGREAPWLIIISLPLSLLCLFGPFYAAAWCFRLCLRLADRYIHNRSPTERIA